MTIREQEIPTCPACGKSDRVEYHGKGAKYATTQPSESPLRDWWCSRCHGWLSALPALPPRGGLSGRVSEAGPKRGKEGGGDG